MKIVKPSIEVIMKSSQAEVLKNIEKFGRICYKSDKNKTETSYMSFADTIIKRGHLSVIEHETISVIIICDRGVTHELVRHRIGSYCLSENTKILRYNQNREHNTIKELYNMQQGDSRFSGKIKLMQVRSVNENNIIIPNKIKSIIKSGVKDVYELTTKLGYKIKSTKEHLFFNNSGCFSLGELKIGDNVFINGRKCLVDIPDEHLIKKYISNKLSPEEMATELCVPYRSVVRKLKKLGVFKSRLNDKNKEKYNKNHTKESYEKISNTARNQYKFSNRVIWNKGLDESDPRQKRVIDNLRLNHHNNGYGNKNSRYVKNRQELSKSAKYSEFRISKKEACEICGEKTNLENHHKDTDVNNMKDENKLTLCIKCHKLVHYGYNVKKVIEDRIVKIKYIGKEETYDIEMCDPYHNFIADGFLVHNSQESSRYVNYKEGIEFIQPCFWKGKDDDLKRLQWENAMLFAENTYKEMIKLGATPEEARSVLPNSTKTEIAVTFNMREWRHFLEIRGSKRAHPQMREIACMILSEFHKKMPIIFDDLKLGSNNTIYKETR